MIAEIASQKARLKDPNVKFKDYEGNGEKYFIIADPDKDNIEVFMLKDNWYQKVNTSTFHLTASCSVELEFQTIWQ